jgi:hypothetical protein
VRSGRRWTSWRPLNAIANDLQQCGGGFSLSIAG